MSGNDMETIKTSEKFHVGVLRNIKAAASIDTQNSIATSIQASDINGGKTPVEFEK